MRGRKPKPTALKDLHGSKEPINRDEPIPEGNLADEPTNCPPHFDADQRAAWDFALRHSPPGMLKRIDGSALEAWVVAHCMHRKATAAMGRGGLLFRPPGSSFPVQSPYIPIINRQALIMLKAAGELGFTPVARPRILATAGAAAGEPLTGASHGRAKDKPEQSLEEYLLRAPSATAVH